VHVEGSQAASGRTSGAGSGNLEKAKVETKHGGASMRDYAYRRRRVCRPDEEELVSIQDDWNQLGAKVESAGGSAKADA